MALLKEAGSLDVERINQLPIEEYMKEIGNLTIEQYKEYCSKTPINENHEPTRVVEVDYTLAEDMEINGTVILDDVLNNLRKKSIHKQ